MRIQGVPEVQSCSTAELGRDVYSSITKPGLSIAQTFAFLRLGEPAFSALMLPNLPPTKIRLHSGRLHPHHGVHLPHCHTGGDAAQVRQPHLLHPLFPQPLHGLALAGHCLCLRGDSHVHRGVEQPQAPPGPLEEEAEGGIAAGYSLHGPFYCFIEQSSRKSP